MEALNGISGTSYNETTGQNGGPLMGVIFPELRDLVGYYIAHNNFGAGNPVGVFNLAWSANTTNGYDGAWTNLGTPTFYTTMANFRSPTALSVTGAKAIRYNPQQTGGAANAGSITYGFHVYGKPSTGQALDRLRIWHPTLDQEMAGPGLDFGDYGRGYTIDRTFRIKNNSSSLSANSIVLSFEALPNDASPTVVSMMSLSQGGAFASTQNIGTLAPGEISGVCTLRIASPSNTTLGLWRQRLIATAGSWT